MSKEEPQRPGSGSGSGNRDRAGTDVQQALIVKEEVSRSSNPDYNDTETVHIKEEEEELWTGPDQEPFHNPSEYSGLPFTIVTVKTEDLDEDEPQCSHAGEAEPPATLVKWIKTEIDGGDCRRLELVSKNLDGQASDSSGTAASNEEDDWQEPLSDARNDADDGAKAKSGLSGNLPVKKPFSCTECGKQFLYKQSLKRHMRRNTEKSSSSSCFASPKCSEVPLNVDQLKTKVHTGKKKFGCEDCGKTFRDHFSLKSHMRVHSEEKPFGCNDCGKSFKHEHNLKIHMRIHTGEMPFGCEVCGKRFKHQHNLKTHMRIHTGEKPFVCDICGKRARHQNNLKTHMIVHKGERPFGCDLCGKSFNRKTSLRAHMTVHTGEKPYGCEICGKCYKRKTHLRTHMTVHTEEKPFGCEVCGKRFNRKTHLGTHMAVHTGEKPYSCDFCGKRFTRKTHLDSHITVHTGEKPFGCGVCGQEFTQQGSLNRHMRFHLG
ncbi:gastrula zinc finger protein XlCGF57.1-like [Cololabis saira]|uniref:gastrula zinc finger protein XlCGF57.1-like n=1 Tax=Cololabis saira TaxID=129043 RepID=UPI002AD33992|nr:gastrula zinc finger protein XlCGF57.1-like [Cololabis saira]